MLWLCTLSVVIPAVVGRSARLLSVNVNNADASFNVTLGDTPWLVSKSPRLFSGGSWTNLTLVGSGPATPLKGFGAGRKWRWSASGPAGEAVWETSIRKSSDGADAVMFSQNFVKELVVENRGSIGPLCPNISHGNVPPGCATPAKLGSRVVADEVAVAEFPSVRVVEQAPALGAFCGAGMSDGPRVSVFNDADYDPESDTNVPGNWGGSAGGPTALFDDSAERKTLIISPAGENILSTIWWGMSGAGEMAVGPGAGVPTVPKDHAVHTIMLAGYGMRQTFEDYGDAMMAFSGAKSRGSLMKAMKNDRVLSHLGYSTTGCYQYNPCDCGCGCGNDHGCPAGKGTKTSRCSCQQCGPRDNATIKGCKSMGDTFLLADKYIREDLGLNYSHILMDSFWYGESVNPGVWKWEDTPDLVYDLFPQGLQATYAALLKQRGGMPIEIKAHSTNWWYGSPHRNDSRFASTNFCNTRSGTCVNDTRTQGTFLPGVELYSFLFKSGKKWGLSYIKQDHEGGGPPQGLGINVGRNWYKAMGDGAAAAGSSVSYCGMVPRVLMNSVSIGSSTHARASHDYVPGQEIGQWAVGGPSVFLWGLGLLPYKDTWMSTSATPLNRKSPRPPYTIDTVSERAPLLHTISAIVTGGPVAFGDCVGGPLAANRPGSPITSNAKLLQLLARQDGTLLKTDKPGRSVDITWLNRVFNSSDTDAARAELWTGSSSISGVEHGVIFASSHSTAIAPSFPDLHLPDVDSVVWAFNNSRFPSPAPSAPPGPPKPCNRTPQPCPNTPGHTFCPSDPRAGQCQDSPRKTCPPCPPPPPLAASHGLHAHPLTLPVPVDAKAGSRLTIPSVCKSPGGRHPTRSCSNYDNSIFALWYSSPVLANGMALLGEYAKAVPVSAQRFSSITVASSSTNRTANGGLKIGLLGSQGEQVTVAIWTGQKVVTKTATIGRNGTATLSF